MPKLLVESAIKVDEDGELTSFWPETWPLPKLVEALRNVGSLGFAAAYMNDLPGAEEEEGHA